jgi:hypothetical protein
MATDFSKKACDRAPKQEVLTPEAARRRAETTRIRIQTTALIDKLQNHALGLSDMTPTQLQAAQTLLKKTLPDMVSMKAEMDVSPIIFKLGS